MAYTNPASSSASASRIPGRAPDGAILDLFPESFADLGRRPVRHAEAKPVGPMPAAIRAYAVALKAQVQARVAAEEAVRFGRPFDLLGAH